MIPVDAAIWKEGDVRRNGVSVESVLDVMKEQGASAKLVVIDASRRNPYERRFRAFSHGLAPIVAPDNALILTSATPGKVADDGKGQHSVLVTELLTNIGTRDSNRPAAAEAIFNKTRNRHRQGQRRRAGAERVFLPARRRQLRRHRQGRQLGRLSRTGIGRRRAVGVNSPRRRGEVTLLHIRAACGHRADRVAFAQQRAGAGHHDVAFGEPLLDLDLAARHQPDFDPPGFDARPPHHLHHGAGVAVEQCGQRHRDVGAALPGLDHRAPGGVHQKGPVGGDGEEGLAELAIRFRPSARSAAPGVYLAGAGNPDPRGLADWSLAMSSTGTIPTMSNSPRAMIVNSASPLPDAIAPITAVGGFDQSRHRRLHLGDAALGQDQPRQKSAPR